MPSVSGAVTRLLGLKAVLVPVNRHHSHHQPLDPSVLIPQPSQPRPKHLLSERSCPSFSAQCLAASVHSVQRSSSPTFSNHCCCRQPVSLRRISSSSSSSRMRSLNVPAVRVCSMDSRSTAQHSCQTCSLAYLRHGSRRVCTSQHRHYLLQARALPLLTVRCSASPAVLPVFPAVLSAVPPVNSSSVFTVSDM